jgi:hypothetical protein
MVNKAKQVGSNWEHDLVEILNKKIEESSWKRIAGSGAIGTSLNEPLLTGDVKGEIEGFYKKFKGECKAGYNSSSNKEVKQFTLKKEWLDKIKAEAEVINHIPILFGKFTGARSGVKHFAVLDLNYFIELINEYIELKADYDKLFIAIQESKRNG